MLKTVLQDRRGNFAMMFAVCSIPLIGSVGLMVDCANITRVHASLQHTADTADTAAREVNKANFKRNGQSIEIFTLGVSDATAPETLAYEALHNCVTSADHHFFVRDWLILIAPLPRYARN
jgi:uncharacterized membrane protein